MTGDSIEVLIAGAGPVGLTLAGELERLGVGVRVTDRAPGRTVLSRATDLHARSLELWDHTGVADEIMAAALPITGAPLISGGRLVARLDFTGIDSPFPAAVSLRQHDLERLLSARLTCGVEWASPVHITGQDDEGVTAVVGTGVVRAKYVVACDGVHSELREALQIPFDGSEFAGRWAVIDARIDGWPYGPAELPVFLDHDGFWAMPLPGGQLRMFFRDDDAGPAPTVEDGQRIIDRHVAKGARIVAAENLACFQLQHRVARRFRHGRVFLAGDAAHAMTPVKGQGMNTGIQDVYNLAWKLGLALDGAPPALLDSYEIERRPVAIATTTESTEGHESNVLTGAAGAARDRMLAASLATPVEVLNAVAHGHELGVAYDASPIVGPGPAPGAAGVLPGQRIPDVGPLQGVDGAVTSARELMRDPRVQVWACVGIGPPDHTATLLAPFATAVTARIMLIADRPPMRPDGVEVLADPTLRVHGRLGAVNDALYVVRPDGYLGARIEPPDAHTLAVHLRRLGLSGRPER